jgi:hypothetical protein
MILLILHISVLCKSGDFFARGEVNNMCGEKVGVFIVDSQSAHNARQVGGFAFRGAIIVSGD